MRKSIKYLSRQETKFLKLCRLPFQKSRKKKINALARLKNYLTSDQINLLLNSVIKSYYCPLIWMFTSRYLNNALNNIHERALRLIYIRSREIVYCILTENNPKTIQQKTFNFLQLK